MIISGPSDDEGIDDLLEMLENKRDGKVGTKFCTALNLTKNKTEKKLSERLEKIVGKGETAITSIFPPFSTMLLKGSFLGVSVSWNCVVKG